MADTAAGLATGGTTGFAPQANAIAERLIDSIRRECLDHSIVVNVRHLRRVLREYVRYYNAARPRRALDLDAPVGSR